MTATKPELEALHAKVATKLTDALDQMDHETKGLAAVLNVARQFLKDNNIEAVPAPGTPLGKLADKVTEFPFDPAEDARPN